MGFVEVMERFLSGIRSRIADDRGITTVSMAICIFLSVALIFSGAQLYRVSSASAEIQEVADACALAAENEVAEFVCAVNVCDALILSFTLFSGTLYGIGIVTACIPPLFGISEKIIEIANRSIDIRDRFYQVSVKSLNTLMKLLPFLSAANAYEIAKANQNGALRADHYAVSALVPETGVEFKEIEQDALKSIGSSINGNIEEIRDYSQKAEDKAKEALEAKERAFEYDCGNAPSNCMYERASSLSSISVSDNPLYTNVDLWSIEVALNRAKAYYVARASNVESVSGSVESQADAVLRQRFYDYAVEEFSSAYVIDTDDHFEMDLPHLFRNTSEMRETELYTETIYPITSSEGSRTMHAWSGCPRANSIEGYGSISNLDEGDYVTCPSCRFTVSSLGKVAAASTSIGNGFEYHYEHMREAAQDYEKARSELDPLKRSVKNTVSPLLDAIGNLFEDAATKRLKADPPGKFGAIAMVVNTAKAPADTGFANTFVKSGTTLGTCAAVSGAALLEDQTSEGSSVITRIISGLKIDGALGDALGIAASCWSGMLKTYEDGQNALFSTISSCLDSFSTTTLSGLGDWVSDSMKDVVNAVGLQPADLRSKLPVLLNTSYVAQKDSGSFAVNFLNVKNKALSLSAPTSTLMSTLANKAAGEIRERIDKERFTIVEITLPFASESFTIDWILPESVSNGASSLIEECIARISSSIESLGSIRSWQ